MNPAIAALIPVYNGADHVADVIRGTRRWLREVLVVDDGSLDQTARVARESGARVLRLPSNRGKGAAIRAGLSVLLGETHSHVLMLDGDGQHEPDDIPKFIAAATEADFVLGNRLWCREAIPPRRMWTNHVGTTALRLMTGFPLEDSQCGYRLVAATLLRRMGLVGKRYSVDTELLIRAGKLGAAFAHVPVTVIYAGEPSHFRPVRDTVHIVFSAVRFKVDEGDLRRDPGQEYWRVYRAPEFEVLPSLDPDSGIENSGPIREMGLPDAADRG